MQQQMADKLASVLEHFINEVGRRGGWAGVGRWAGVWDNLKARVMLQLHWEPVNFV